jgi:hypothetical protein
MEEPHTSQQGSTDAPCQQSQTEAFMCDTLLCSNTGERNPTEFNNE